MSDNKLIATTREMAKEVNVSPTTVTETLKTCLLYTSDAADDSLRGDLGGCRLIKKKKKRKEERSRTEE
ncbi:Firmicute plasmid replication protein (RepL) [Clostridioides difficile]|nr:Firmicute plasmid replication protein (RepL) [Clostridioides difficile]